MKHIVNWIPKAAVLAYALVGGYFAFRTPKKSWYHYLALAAGVSAIVLAIQRDFWLTFLGDAVLPSSLIPLRKNTEAVDITRQIKVPPGSKVIYWAAEKNILSAANPWQAYGEFENAGVTLADESGTAVLEVATPRGYTVPSGKFIPSHIHYRVLHPSGAMMGPVQTLFV